MSIRFKLILLLVLSIMGSSMPLSFFILNRLEKDKDRTLSQQAAMSGRVLARSALTILVMNGGDITATRLDAADMETILTPFVADGLIYAETVLSSSKPDLNGAVIYRKRWGTLMPAFNPREKNFQPDRVADLLTQEGTSTVTLTGSDAFYAQYISVASPANSTTRCISRVIFSRDRITHAVDELRRIVILATLAAIAAAGTMGYLVSRLITRPITRLSGAVSQIENNDFSVSLPAGTDELGRLSGAFTGMAHIINQKIAELQAINERLSTLDVLKDEFLANISHELRTPLHGIIGLSESLLDGIAGTLPDQAIRDLTMVTASGKRLAGMINNMLDFSKLRHSDIILDLGPVSMHSLVQLVIAILRPAIEQKGLAITNTIDPEQSWVRGDANRLQQVMLNLLGNAVKFTETGSIALTSSAHEGKPGLAGFILEDTGVGIPEGDEERIFTLFEQVDGTDARRYGGAGLGLTISRKIIELHGGTITAARRPDGGTRFSFTLPRTDERPAAAPVPDSRRTALPAVTPANDEAPHPDRSDSAPDGATGLVLVVDDEPVNLQVMTNHLELAGYRVTTAADGAAALEFLRRGELPDLILLDVMMPGISGYDVCRTIRGEWPAAELPVLMLTAKNRIEDIVTGIEAGASDYLTKPVNRQEMLARVASLVSLKRSVEVQKRLSIIRNELAIAHEIQETILPPSLPVMDNLTVALRYSPMTEIGGDFYDFHVIDEQRIGVLIADVSGHGIPAALVCAMLQVAYSIYIQFTEDPSKLFRLINQWMCRYPHGQYLTASHVVIDLEDRTMRHTNAGHKPLLVQRAADGAIIWEPAEGRPIGIYPDAEFRTTTYDISDGDRIVLYTDGITDIKGKNKQLFGDDRLKSFVASNRGMAADELADRIMATAQTWADEGAHGDDATVIVLDIAYGRNYGQG